MNEEFPSGVGRECDDPSRQLLDFYVNGSLEPADIATVRSHLETCSRCALEISELSQIAAALERHGIDPASAGPRRWTARRFLWVAASLAAVSVGLYVLQSRGTGVGPPPLDDARVAHLDLGAGVPRNAQGLPQVDILRSSQALRVTLLPPVHPRARYLASIASAGVVVCPEAPLGPLDAMGRGTITFPALALDHPGSYELILRIEARDAEGRSYRYPFEVRRTGESP